MSDLIPMTRTGYDKIKAQLDHLELVEMPKIAERIAAARAEGDLKENAEYHGQREEQGRMEARIRELKGKLAMALIMDPAKIKKDEVGFGATVRVKDIDIDEEEEITLVGAGEEDYDSGKYLITSPVGQGLLGKKVGEVANIAVPKGTISFEVLEIKYNF